MTSDLYRPYHYPEDHPRAGELSGEGLTPKGLETYLAKLSRLHPEILSMVQPLISGDPSTTPEFNDKFFEEAYSVLKNSNGRIISPVYRPNHTVGIIKEEDNILLVDSYNAYGAKDADHIPLLRFLRDTFRGAKIHTLHDKMQNDYHNCAFFAVQNLIKVERELKSLGISLPEFIEQIDTHKLHLPTIGNINDLKKIQSYGELDIRTVATPACLVPHIQSLKQARATAEGSADFRRRRLYLPYGTHENELERFVETREHKGKPVQMNVNIQTQNDEFRRATCIEF
ncbi:MAG: hypothetical protein FWE79_03325 [Firmicutes bacterium]|nr:hypothetical protein [Bacillota bacterium]